MKKYCTFWYPTIFHQNLMRLYSEDVKLSDTCDLEKRNISDTRREKNQYETVKSFVIDITLDWEENLIVESTLGMQLPFTVKLCRTDDGARKNGFVKYSYETNDIPSDHLVEFEDALRKDIYHLAKMFYHKHEADSSKDSALRAIITDENGMLELPEGDEELSEEDKKLLRNLKTDLWEDDNVFLVSLLLNFTSVFINFAQNLSASNFIAQDRESLLEDVENELRKRKNKNLPISAEDSKSVLKARNGLLAYILDINKMCENASIEYTYCKTLLCSRHNKSFCDDAVNPLNDCKDDCRRKSLNIKNPMRYIENIKYKNQNRLNRLSQYLLDEMEENTDSIKKVLIQNKKTEKMNSIIAWFSVFLAIIFGSVYFVGNDKKSLGFKIWGIVSVLVILYFIKTFWTEYRRSKESIPVTSISD